MSKAERYREMTVDDLTEENRALAEQLFKLRVQRATGQLENVAKIRDVRKNIARVKTILTQKGQSAS